MRGCRSRRYDLADLVIQRRFLELPGNLAFGFLLGMVLPPLQRETVCLARLVLEVIRHDLAVEH